MNSDDIEYMKEKIFRTMSGLMDEGQLAPFVSFTCILMGVSLARFCMKDDESLKELLRLGLDAGIEHADEITEHYKAVNK